MDFLFNFIDDDDDDDDEEEEEQPTMVRHKTRNTDGSNKDKLDTELLIEPKSEYEDGNEDAVEDLTMADEELMEDLDQAGPSHGGEGSSQGRFTAPKIKKIKIAFFFHRQNKSIIQHGINLLRLRSMAWISG